MLDGPDAVDTPAWLRVWIAIALVGVAMGWLPVLLMKLLQPQLWMVHFAKVGVWVSIIGMVPFLLRTGWVVSRSLWRWRHEQIEICDESILLYRSLAQEFAGYPSDELAEYVKFVRRAMARLTTRLGWLVGSIEKFGVLPILVAVVIQIRGYSAEGHIPAWQAILGAGLAFAYLIAVYASMMRFRLEIYEVVLSDALELAQAATTNGVREH